MTDTNRKLRALFLTALMVFSVFAGTVALSGTAAANHASTDEAADEHLVSGSTFWQGQDVWFDVKTQSQNDALDSTVQVRRINDDNEIGGLETELSPHANGNGTIGTSNLDGDYILVNSTHAFRFTGTNGVSTSATARENINTGQNASSWGFEIAVQDLSAAFDDDDLPTDTGSTATIEMDSTRASYVVNVTAEGLDEEDLGDVFDAGDGNTVVSASTDDDDDDDSIQLRTTNDGAIEANFTELDSGSYTFDFEVNDTTASASASVDVSEEDVTLSFTQSIHTVEQGDLAAIPITLEDTTEGYLWVGDDDVNYLERVHFTDDDDDGLVVILMNTRWAGTALSAAVDGDDDNSSASSNYVGYLLPPDSDDEINSVTRWNTTNSTSGMSDLDNDIQDEAFDTEKPLDATDYPLALSSSGDAPNSTSSGELVIADEEDVATLDITERSTDGISTWVAPTDNTDLDVDDDEEVQELLDSLSPASTVGVDANVGDRLVVRVNASGFNGYLVDQNGFNGQLNGSWTGSSGGPGYASGIYFNLTSDAGSNRASANVDLASGGAQVIDGGPVGPNSFLVAIDTRDYNELGDGDRYTVSFQVGNEGLSASPNPYVDDEEEEEVEADVSFSSVDADFDNIVTEELQVTQDSNATVSGTTNSAPGEELTVRLRKTGDSPFLMTQTVEVASDGAFEATFDTSDIPVGTEFTAVVREGSVSISDTEDAVIVETPATPTPTTEPPETTTEPPETTTEPPETTTAPPETTTEPPATTESPGQPGFGLAIAIVALLGAALLALRRRD